MKQQNNIPLTATILKKMLSVFRWGDRTKIAQKAGLDKFALHHIVSNYEKIPTLISLIEDHYHQRLQELEELQKEEKVCKKLN